MAMVVRAYDLRNYDTYTCTVDTDTPGGSGYIPWMFEFGVLGCAFMGRFIQP